MDKQEPTGVPGLNGDVVLPPNAHHCPRRAEVAGYHLMKMLPPHDVWRQPSQTCSWCGSLNPDVFMQALRDGAELGPTDKNYKAYIEMPNPHAGKLRVAGLASHDRPGDGWVHVDAEVLTRIEQECSPDGMRPSIGDWVTFDKEPAKTTAKFYYQHLSKAQQADFVTMLNNHAFNIGFPHHLYVLPFFVAKEA